MSNAATTALTLLLVGLLYLYLWFVARSVGSHLSPTTSPEPTAAVSSLALKMPSGRTHSVDRPLVVGRDPGADIVLDDPFTSELHARFSVDHGHLTVTDLDSTNGTFVNGNRISGSMALDPGDVVRLGETIMEVR